MKSELGAIDDTAPSVVYLDNGIRDFDTYLLRNRVGRAFFATLKLSGSFTLIFDAHGESNLESNLSLDITAFLPHNKKQIKGFTDHFQTIFYQEMEGPLLH